METWIVALMAAVLALALLAVIRDQKARIRSLEGREQWLLERSGFGGVAGEPAEEIHGETVEEDGEVRRDDGQVLLDGSWVDPEIAAKARR